MDINIFWGWDLPKDLMLDCEINNNTINKNIKHIVVYFLDISVIFTFCFEIMDIKTNYINYINHYIIKISLPIMFSPTEQRS